ncbi:class I SAM-dependent methyltransferase [Isoptericola sp. NPDC019693]|uniref:class I SAM-dependent methyltransferase n=1 Tax=Isoptericola sp. NPDC019693 TaxID=3364009 RepID=UPI00378B15CD
MNPSANGGSASLESSDYWWYRTRTHLLRTVLGRYTDGAGAVLDVGSADGPSVGWLRGRDHHVTLDLDPRGLAPGSGVCGSADALPFADGAFDVVGAFDVLEHCDREDRVLAEIRRVLRPGGHFLMTVPAYQWLWSDFDVRNGHVRRYTRGRAVAALGDGGFEILRATYAFASTFPAFVVERLARRARGLVKRDDGGAADIVRLPRTPPVADRVLTALGTVDGRLLARRDLPFGSSVVVAARRPPL